MRRAGGRRRRERRPWPRPGVGRASRSSSRRRARLAQLARAVAHRDTALLARAARRRGALQADGRSALLWVDRAAAALAAVFSLFFGLHRHDRHRQRRAVPGVRADSGWSIWLFFTSALTTVSDRARRERAAHLEDVVPAARSSRSPPVGRRRRLRASDSWSRSSSRCVYGVIPPVQVILLPLLVPWSSRSRSASACGSAAISVQATATSGNSCRSCCWSAVHHADRLSVQQHPGRATSSLYAFNPLVGMVELMRWIVLPGSRLPGCCTWLITLVFESAVVLADRAPLLRPRGAHLRRCDLTDERASDPRARTSASATGAAPCGMRRAAL